MCDNRQGRREFLKGTTWMGVAAMAAGCISKGNALGFGKFDFGAGVSRSKDAQST